MMTKILRYYYYKDKIEANYLSYIHMAFIRVLVVGVYVYVHCRSAIGSGHYHEKYRLHPCPRNYSVIIAGLRVQSSYYICVNCYY